MYKICFYVPLSHVETVKNAMFAKGAGQIGNYSCCSWQTLGEGQFMPLEESQAFIGKKHQLEKVSEYKVEIVCSQDCIEEVINALKQTHPYEEPAFQVMAINSLR
jgi:structural hemagglutinin/hemolysin toxin protein RtxA